MCEGAYTEDEDFRKAVVKAKRDRATAKKKLKRSQLPPATLPVQKYLLYKGWRGLLAKVTASRDINSSSWL